MFAVDPQRANVKADGIVIRTVRDDRFGNIVINEIVEFDIIDFHGFFTGIGKNHFVESVRRRQEICLTDDLAVDLADSGLCSRISLNTELVP